MPSYRGISQAELIRSINDALELLETHSTGPEMQAQVDRLRAGAPSPLAAIAAAADDVALAAAVRNSGVTAFFGRAGEVLEYHAVNDTDGRGQDVLGRLVSWSAFGAVATVYTKLDEEADAWLAMNYARQVDMTEENLEKLAMVTDALSQNKVAIGNAFIAATALVEMSHTGSGEDEMRKVFLGLDLHERHILKGSLTALFTLDGAQGALVFQPALRGYGIIVDGLAEGRASASDDAVQAIAGKAEKALDPFRAVDEYDRIMIGVIGDWQNPKSDDPQGIIFIASARAAQAVADALPEMKVIDFEGNAIPPRANPRLPKPGFAL